MKKSVRRLLSNIESINGASSRAASWQSMTANGVRVSLGRRRLLLVGALSLLLAPALGGRQPNAAARAIARRFLAGNPPREQLLGLLRLNRSRFAPRAVRADFAAGEVIVVDGWVLSRTELAACLRHV